MTAELARELARQEHVLQHKIIEEFCGGAEFAALLYPECYRRMDSGGSDGQ